MRLIQGFASATIAIALAATASAASIIQVTDISLPKGAHVTGVVDGRKEYLGPQYMTDIHGKTFTFWCITPLYTNHLGVQDPPIQYVSAQNYDVYGHVPPDNAGQIMHLINLAAKMPSDKLYQYATADALDLLLGKTVTNVTNPWVATEGAALAALTKTNIVGNSYLIPINLPYLGHGQIGMAVPEPASWALMLVGFGGLGTALRRRRQVVAA
jgi:hypothetical protein